MGRSQIETRNIKQSFEIWHTIPIDSQRETQKRRYPSAQESKPIKISAILTSISHKNNGRLLEWKETKKLAEVAYSLLFFFLFLVGLGLRCSCRLVCGSGSLRTPHNFAILVALSHSVRALLSLFLHRKETTVKIFFESNSLVFYWAQRMGPTAQVTNKNNFLPTAKSS